MYRNAQCVHVSPSIDVSSSDTNYGLQVIKNAEIVFLAVKPQFVAPVLKEVRQHLTEKHTIVSIAAGKTLASLKVPPFLPCLQQLTDSIVVYFHTSAVQNDTLVVSTLHTTTDIRAVIQVAGSFVSGIRGLGSKQPETAEGRLP